MKFITYWLVCIGLAFMGIFERLVCEIQGHEYSIVFWVIIAIAGFFWLCGYGDIQEGKNKKPPTGNTGDDTSNPFQ